MNVFHALGFGAEEAAVLRVTSQLLVALTAFVGRFQTQREAAEALGVKQPRVSEIATGQLDRPKSLPERMRAVQQVIASGTPPEVESVAGRFKRARKKDVGNILGAPGVLGLVQTVRD